MQYGSCRLKPEQIQFYLNNAQCFRLARTLVK